MVLPATVAGFFANNPAARYAALAGLIGVAIANMNGFDLKALGQQLGLS
jgi:hypothetical protein